MTHIIDAWLDQPHPRLRVLDADSQSICLSLSGSDLEGLWAQGEVQPTDLTTTDPQRLKEIVRGLFLYSYARSLPEPERTIHLSAPGS